MSTVLKVALLILLVQLVGALHYAVPFFVRAFAPPIHNEHALKHTPGKGPGGSDPSALVRSEKHNGDYHGSALWPAIDLDDLRQGSLLVESAGENPLVGRLPLLDSDFDVQVTGLSAQTKLTQSFHNPLDSVLQGKFVFPLPPNAAVFGMKLIIGEKVIVGEIQPKAEARATFERAKRSGKKASLLTQHRPNVFSTEVANIQPGDDVRIEITYQQALPVDQRTVSLRIPNSIKPRYTPQQKETPNWAKNPANVSDENAAFPSSNVTSDSLRINILINGIDDKRGVLAKNFAVKLDDALPDSLLVQARTADNINQDFVLTWPLSDEDAASPMLFTERWQGHTYGLLLLSPPKRIDHQQLTAQDWHFVIDTSGSMHGAALSQAKHALLYALNALREDDLFNILGFDSVTQPLWQQSRPASAQNKHLARAFVEGLQADGGTEIALALEQTFAQLRLSHQDTIRQQIVFLTDGSVGNEAQLMNLIHANIEKTRLFTVGIGAAPNAYFMQEAALTGHGAYVYIDDTRQVSGQMQQLIDKITRPALTDLNLDMASDAAVFPSPLPDLYAGEPLQVVFRQENPVIRLGIEGETGLRDEQRRWEEGDIYPIETRQSGIHRLWARQQIAQLQRERRRAHDVAGFNQKIEQVAMRHQLVSDRTSLVAVEEAAAEPLRQSHSAMAMRLPQTATPMTMNALAGMLCLLISTLLWRRWSDK